MKFKYILLVIKIKSTGQAYSKRVEHLLADFKTEDEIILILNSVPFIISEIKGFVETQHRSGLGIKKILPVFFPRKRHQGSVK